MKKSLATSTTVHVVLLSWGLLSLSGPERLDAGIMETLPVDIVPISELTQIQQGERTAPIAETSAPEPVETDAPEPDAQNVGNNTVDLDSPPTPEARPETVEEAAAPAPTPEPVPQPEPVPEPEPEPEPVEPAEAPPPPEPEAPAPEPEQEVAALPEPAEAEAPEAEPLPEAPEAAAPAEPEVAALPENIPTPMSRPEPPRPQVAQQPEPAERPQETPPQQPQQAQQETTERESEFDADQIAALLNQQAPSGGGQRQADNQQAALGGQQTTGGESLSQSELDALRGQIQRCWNVVPGMADATDVRIRVGMRLAPDGTIQGQPSVSASGGSDMAQRTLSGSALRAVLRCAPYSLPAEKYETWSEVVVNFDPSQMF